MSFSPRAKAPASKKPRLIPEASVISVPGTPHHKTPYSLDVKAAADGAVTITLPAAVAKYLGLDEGKPENAPLFYCPINGVVQLSAWEPGVCIPAESPNAAHFHDQGV